MKQRHIHLIACGVLRIDFNALPKKPGIRYTTTWLEGGLHARPAELRTRLQAAIDEVDEADLIAVGYGLCGRGTVGIHAREIPLAIPRVHDCISLFLGSDEAYRREFSRNPGTYYISAGWFEEKVQPRGAGDDRGKPDVAGNRRTLEELTEKYGEDNAKEIHRFLSSWQRNYSRSVFIDTGNTRKRTYEEYAKAMAEEFGWEFQRLEGSLDLLEALLRFEGDERILRVPPNYLTAFDPLTKKLVALPQSGKVAGLTAENASPEAGAVAAASAANQAAAATNTATDSAPAGPAAGDGRTGFGLGIDAGGTYTDVVVFDFGRREVVDAAKALTTKWDYTVGIDNALDGLSEKLSRIELVAVSTTLATNAIVEQTGRATGLILMPPAGLTAEGFPEPAAVISGRMDIQGNETEPIDADEVRKIVTEMRKKHGVQAFAVSGYAGVINPAHEIIVRDIIVKTTGLDVCCGHELSDLLDFRIRAQTAALNAGIIPLIERFLKDAGKSLEKRGINAPLMVVKGDGTLMRESRARVHPVETILSGPAASLAGAKYLTGNAYATAVDVGGTTSDIGRIDNGRVNVHSEGAVVGRWRTHVRAVDMHTLGLGGDSEIFVEKTLLHVGPKRVAPVCWLASTYDCRPAVEHIKKHPDDYALDTRLAEMFVATGRGFEFEPSDQERMIIELIEKTPLTALQLVETLKLGHPALLQTKRLEADFIIQRCGLTPTDLLHHVGKVLLWDADAASDYLDALSLVAGKTASDLCDAAFTLITERLMFELVKRQLPLNYSGEDLEDSVTAKALFDTLLKGGNPNLKVSARLNNPVIGLGAAAAFFLSEPVNRLSAELILPRYAEVANAIGAITSQVHVTRSGSVTPSADGLYLVTGVPGNRTFANLRAAHDALVKTLRSEVLKMAKDAGTDETQVEIEYEDRIGSAADGTAVFLSRNVTAGVTGGPHQRVESEKG